MLHPKNILSLIVKSSKYDCLEMFLNSETNLVKVWFLKIKPNE